MFEVISEHVCSEKLYESARSVVYRGHRVSDRAPVVIKVHAAPAPTPDEVARFRREFEIARGLHGEGVVEVYSLERHRNRLALVMKDLGATALDLVMARERLGLEQALRIASRIAAALAEIHAQRVIHKDINPANVVLRADTGQIKLIDFGISTVLSQESPTARAPDRLEGTLAYISPEQTGRMNRPVDYRTDFYSFGVMLYQMLTGAVPFHSTDPMELVHFHLARKPTPPRELDARIPEPVSELVLRLLAKTAEERYQSARGLKADLDECLAHLGRGGPEIVLGRHDVSPELHIPQKLYGRAGDVDVILSTFERASRGSAELVLVSGYSGIGKSALVHEVHKPVAAKRGYFISGKFEQLRRNVPYAPLIQAFQGLIRQLLSESEGRLAALRARLLSALGPSGQLICAVIPEVELIIGPQRAVREVGSESERRFNHAFQSFVRAFAAAAHPLVLFLDDLQWADAASLKLLRMLLTEADLHFLCVIGAYRDNEVTPGHPLTAAIEAIEAGGTSVTSVTLAPLGLADVIQLVSETLRCSRERAAPLAALALAKTGGNPFFLRQFLGSLVEERLLSFHPEAAEWQWDMEATQEARLTDNVVELMAGKIQRLPERVQRVLELAACIGNEFDLRTLSIVSEQSLQATALDLWGALTEGLVLPIGDAYRMADPAALAELAGEAPEILYRFLHDRVQHAAYLLIPVEDRAEIHHRVGRLLLAGTKPAAVEDRVFDIVHHLDQGAARITDDAERYRAAELFLIAGNKARASAAYEPALRYLERGLALLPQGAVRERRELAFALHLAAIGAAYLNGRRESADELCAAAGAIAETPLEKARLLEAQVLFHASRGQAQETVELGLSALALLGVVLPADPTPADIGAAIGRNQAALAGRAHEELVDLPEITDPQRLTALQLLHNLAAPAYTIRPLLYVIISCEMLRCCLENGNSLFAPVAYANYGPIVAMVLGDLRGAEKWADLGMALLERTRAAEPRSTVLLVVGVFVRPFVVDVRSSLALLHEATHSGIETGDLEHAAHAATNVFQQRLFVGDPLDALLDEEARYLDLLRRIKIDFQTQFMLLMRQAAMNLAGRNPGRARLQGECFDESNLHEAFRGYHSGPPLIGLFGGWLALHFGDPATAVARFEVVEQSPNAFQGMLFEPFLAFHHALALCGALEGVTPEERARRLARVDQHLGRLRAWAEPAPMNFLHMADLVEAARARAQGDYLRAMDLFERAITGAGKNRRHGDEALACELAGDMYLALGRQRIAESYLTDARNGYLGWGAAEKAAWMTERYPGVFAPEGRPVARGATTITTTTDSRPGSALDLLTVMKAAHTISAEIVLDQQLATLMNIVIENAGAQRGVLLLAEGSGLFIEAEGTVGEPARVRREPLATEDHGALSAGVVFYVARTRTSVVLHDAAEEGLFRADPYIERRRPKSVLCMPLVNQGKLVAIIYLENNLAPGAFTADRMEVLELLLAQAALSLHNATLYATLEHKVEQRTAELRDKNEELAVTLLRLRETQKQLVTQEKLAAIGALAAGIAHELRNPLNFINNFADLSAGLVSELGDQLGEGRGDPAELAEVIGDLRQNVERIGTHGRRANAIINGMLQHTGRTAPSREPANLAVVLMQSATVAYQGVRAKRPEIEVAFRTRFDDALGPVDVSVPDISRVFGNVVNNACYALREKARRAGPGFVPEIVLGLADLGERVEVRIRDNGTGIPEGTLEHVFDPFFTTKPTGEGTGLGLSLSHDVVVGGHRGSIRAESVAGEWTEIIIVLPKRAAAPGS